MRKRIIYSFLLILTSTLFLLSCKDNGTAIPEGEENPTAYDWTKHQPFETDYIAESLPVSTDYVSSPQIKGEVKLEESSGLAWSVKNPGMLWTHNDSGNSNVLYLLDTATAEIVATYQILNTVNTDWEDVAVSTGPIEGESYVYISNTGDNAQKRNNYIIYRFVEPVFKEADRGKTVRTEGLAVDAISFRYPDGNHDAEAILVDPMTHDIFLTTKRDEVSHLYVIPYPQSTSSSATVYLAGYFSFREASGSTMNLQGDKAIIRNRQHLFYWTRGEGESTVQMLSRTPVQLPYVGEVQGEAVCFDDQDNYYTTSEQGASPVYPPLYKYFTKK